MVISLKNLPPEELSRDAGEAAKRLRLSRNITRDDLAKRSGIPVSTLRRFESTGLAPFLTVVRLAQALGREEEIEALFKADEDLPDSLDEMLEQESSRPRQRASKPR